jgi:hypothetical protein
MVPYSANFDRLRRRVSWLADGRRSVHLSGKPGCRWATEIPLASGIYEEPLSRFLTEINKREDNRIVRTLDYGRDRIAQVRSIFPKNYHKTSPFRPPTDAKRHNDNLEQHEATTREKI